MNGTRAGMGWGARFLVALALILGGAAAATWGLAHYQPAARLLGIVPQQRSAMPIAKPVVLAPHAQLPATPIAAAQTQAENQRIADLETRIGRVESATARAEGSAGRADALVIAFAARRAIDRGIALGYLENLLVDRFGAQHRAAVATIITASHQPVRLDELIAEYDAMGQDLRRGEPGNNWWSNFRHEIGALVEIHSVGQPPTDTEARYQLARQQLDAGDVDQALSETMRMPGASRAGDWISKARRYIAAHRGLDEIESAALLPAPDRAG